MSKMQGVIISRIAVVLRNAFNALQTIWVSLGNDKVALLIIGFALTSFAGNFISARFQEQSWERQKQFEILKFKLDSGFALTEQLSSLINNRFFGLQRVLWAVESNPTEVDRLWKEYYMSVIEWNRDLNLYQMKILRLVGEKEALLFLDYADDVSTSPDSIHGRFKWAHDKVLNAKNCVISSCEDQEVRIASAKQALSQLDICSDAFVENLTRTLLERAESMKLK